LLVVELFYLFPYHKSISCLIEKKHPHRDTFMNQLNGSFFMCLP
jgi:hypothetical protein